MRLFNELDVAEGGQSLAFSQQHIDNSLGQYIDHKLKMVDYTTPTRAENTVYQNTSRKIRLVTANVYNNTAGVINLRADAKIGTSSPPTTYVCTAALVSSGVTFITAGWQTPIWFLVPPDYYYGIYDAYSNLAVEYWREIDLH